MTDLKNADTDSGKVELTNPAKLTNTEIKELSQDDGSDGDHNKANADAADNLKKEKADAKAKEADVPIAPEPPVS